MEIKASQSSSPVEAFKQSDLFIENEREALITEIVREMKKDSLKQDASKKLTKEGLGELVYDFFKHPAVLLIIGFLLTGCIGTFLTNNWHRQEWDRQQRIQSKEWERQQRRLLDIKKIDLKYEIIDQLTKAIGERDSAAIQILGPLATKGFDLHQLTTEENEPITTWQKATNDWRISSQIMQLKIGTHIRDEDAAKLFQQIVDTQKTIFINVTDVKNHLKEHYVENKEPSQYKEEDREALRALDAIRGGVKKTASDLKLLVNVIAKEAQADVESPGP
ncbi:MAG TPA: hypothetical protein VK582_15430 [Pyrinomonadaceae bacterium]|nr:hypothetical protein [Pyrinomonadaceae bacterium]